jgi:O-antigen/teichoic acid export membrane protein
VLARLAGTIPLALAAWRVVPLSRPRFERRWIPWLFRFGGWMTVINLVSPLLVWSDRFFIAAISGSTAVTYYTVPFSFASRLSVIPGSLTNALYPRFARLRGRELAELARSSLLSLAAIMTPIVVVGIFVMKPFLWRWLGPQLGVASAPIGETILIGVWINGLAFLPYTMLNAGGKPGVAARFHLLEILPFIFLLWLFLKLWGVEGAAWAWTLRASVDAALLFAVSGLPGRDCAVLITPALIVIGSAAVARMPGAHPFPHLVLEWIAMIAATAWAIAAAPRALKLKVAGALRRRLMRDAV